MPKVFKLDRAKPTTKTAVADASTDNLQAAAKSRIKLIQRQRPSVSVCLLVRLSDLEVESSRIGKIAIKDPGLNHHFFLISSISQTAFLRIFFRHFFGKKITKK